MVKLKKSLLILIASTVLVSSVALSGCGEKKNVVVKSKEDLKGLKVGCQVGTTADESLRKLKKSVDIKTIKKYDQIIETFTDLKTGRLDAIVVDEVVARYYEKKHPKDYKVTGGRLTNEPIGICFRKDDSKIRDKFNALIDDVTNDGFLKKDSIKWFGEDLTNNVNYVGSIKLAGKADSSFKFPADKKKLYVGVDDTYPPMEFTDGSDTIGFDMDLAKELAKRLNMKLVLVSTAWDGIFPALNAGKFDCIISSVSMNEERLKNFSLTKPYIANAQVIVTRPPKKG